MIVADAREKIFAEVPGLPTLPDVVGRVLDLVEKENTPVQELSELIALDPAISTRLLKVANSAYYGVMTNVATVRQAIIVLGFNEVKNLALGIGVFEAFSGAERNHLLDPRGFWLHSVGSALAAQAVCARLSGVDAGIAFTAGLLHDIGRLVMEMVFSEEYRQVLERMTPDCRDCLAEVEAGALGFTHAEAGSWLCERWKFPAVLTAPVRFHHGVEAAPSEQARMVSVVHAADLICRQAGIGSGEGSFTEPVQSAAAEALALTEDLFRELVDQTRRDQDHAVAFLTAIQ